MVVLDETTVSSSFYGYVVKELCSSEEKAEITLSAFEENLINWDSGTASDDAFYIFGPRWSLKPEVVSFINTLAKKQFDPDFKNMDQTEAEILKFKQNVLPTLLG